MKELFSWLTALVLMLMSGIILPSITRAQLAPGPYEILPFEEGFIIEAFFDLRDPTGSIADWSGWSGTSWVSPNAYDGHKGTDIAVQSGTPLYSAVSGVVTQLETSMSPNDHDTNRPYGNFVRIAVNPTSPKGEVLDLLYMHMLTVTVTNGQSIAVGGQVGLSDNTGNSTSEHLHIQSELRGDKAVCPFYWGHFRYPIMFNPNGTYQLGSVVKVKANSTAIRINRFDTSTQIGTAHQDQLFFSSYPKRGYYQVFIPNHTGNRSGWIRATDVEEVFTGTVIQTIPDNVTYTHAGQLAIKYPIRATPQDGGTQIGQIFFGGGRFVADQITNGWYRIPVPGASATWGWVKADNRMIVYPQLYNPAINLEARPNQDFPIIESFSELGKSMFGRPKFTRSVVKNFAPPSPGGDGKAIFVTDANNSGNGLAESILVGKPGHQNYFMQCDVYFNYQPAYVGVNSRWERYGVFMRDDGFAGMTHTFEGGGNGYAILWDNDDGRLRAGTINDATISDLQPSARYVTGSGWRTMRIEARTNQIRFFLDGELLVQSTDSSFPSGPSGFGYRWYPGPATNAIYPATRGAYFDNFQADTLDPVPLRFKQLERPQDGRMRFLLSGDVGSTNLIEKTLGLNPIEWFTFTNVVNSNSVIEFHDDDTHGPCRFYRARKL